MIKGCIAVPIDPDQLHATLRICVVVSRQSSVSPDFILLRDQLDSRVYLGCVIDHADNVQQWVEIWVQDLAGIEEWSSSRRASLSNSLLDDSWLRNSIGFAALDGPLVVNTGWEASNPPAILVDAVKAIPVQADNTPWALCTDDLLLQTHGLPPYSTSLHRYLYLPHQTTEPKFVQMLPTDPIVKPALPAGTLAKEDANLLPFNPAAGRLLVRKLSPISFESVIDILAEGESTEVDPQLDPAGEWRRLREVLDDPSSDGRLLAPHLGHEAKLLEYLHLRIHLINDAVRAVRSWTASTRQPMLNLNAGSFSVQFGDPGAGLPLLWTGKAALRTPGCAVEVKIPGSDFSYYQTVGFTSSAVYAPPLNSNTSGTGNMRITGVRTSTASASILELKLVTQERIFTSSDTLALLRFSIANQRVDLAAKFQEDPSLAPGEYRLRTIEQRHSAELLAALTADTGALIPNVSFEVVPLLASPCDLYALGVLAIRSLLTNLNLSLPEALDRMISFSQHLAGQKSGEMTETQVAALFASENRWNQWLGPQQLSNAGLTAAQAFDVIPARLWYSLLLTIARMLSGTSPVSEFQNLGETSVGSPHRVFDQTIEQLDRLLLRTRSLLVVDWHSNRELGRVIRKSRPSPTSKGK